MISSLPQLYRAVAAGAIGAGMASIADAATRPIVQIGPPEIILFGAAVPIWSALFGLVGVLLARRVAPATAAGAALGPVGNAALTGLLALGVIALIVAGEKRPIVALGWSIGLGYSGLGFIELVARSVVAGAKLVMDAFIEVAARIAAGKRGDGK